MPTVTFANEKKTIEVPAGANLRQEAIKAGLNRLIDNGVSGVVMMGMVGENAQLTPEEKRTVLKIAVETVAGRVPVVSGLAETMLGLVRPGRQRRTGSRAKVRYS